MRSYVDDSASHYAASHKGCCNHCNRRERISAAAQSRRHDPADDARMDIVQAFLPDVRIIFFLGNRLCTWLRWHTMLPPMSTIPGTPNATCAFHRSHVHKRFPFFGALPRSGNWRRRNTGPGAAGRDLVRPFGLSRRYGADSQRWPPRARRRNPTGRHPIEHLKPQSARTRFEVVQSCTVADQTVSLPSAIWRRSSCFWTLPVALRGRASVNTTCPGNLKRAIRPSQ